MAASYSIRVRDRAGTKLEEFDSFLQMDYTKVVNGDGLLRFVVPDTSQFDIFEKDGQVEVWREDTAQGIDPYIDFYGLYRDFELRHVSRANRRHRTILCPSINNFLTRSIVAYPAQTTDRSTFTTEVAETILKTLVTYNATATGTTGDGRIRNVGSWGDYISVASDSTAGSSISISVAHRNLLEALQEVGKIGGLDFDLVKDGTQSWEFQTRASNAYDLTSDIKFSIEWGNMGDPQLRGSALSEKTVAIVGGSGQESSRTFSVRTGPNYVAGYNDIEVFVNSPQQGSDTDSLDAYGDTKLQELRAKEDVNFKVLQTEADRYGRDYCIEGRMGELISVNFGISVTKKIWSATVNLGENASQESISLGMVNV